MSSEASAPERQVQREVGARVCGELIDYRVNGEGGWTRYRVTAQWRRNAYTWWHAMEVATGARMLREHEVDLMKLFRVCGKYSRTVRPTGFRVCYAASFRDCDAMLCLPATWL